MSDAREPTLPLWARLWRRLRRPDPFAPVPEGAYDEADLPQFVKLTNIRCTPGFRVDEEVCELTGAPIYVMRPEGGQ